MATPLDRMQDALAKAREELNKLLPFAVAAAASTTSELVSSACASAGDSEKIIVKAGQDARRAFADAIGTFADTRAKSLLQGDVHRDERHAAAAALPQLILVTAQVTEGNQQVQNLVDQAARLRVEADSASKVWEAVSAATALDMEVNYRTQPMQKLYWNVVCVSNESLLTILHYSLLPSLFVLSFNFFSR